MGPVKRFDRKCGRKRAGGAWFARGAVCVILATQAACMHGDESGDPARGSAANMLTVRGTATYRERMALPADSSLEVTLEDASRADVSGTRIAETRVDPAGQPPVSFSLSYDPSKLVQGHRYALRARITHRGQLLFTTAQHYGLPRDGQTAELVLVRASSANPAQSRQMTQSTAVLENTYWKLTTLGDTAVTVEAQREPHFVLHSEDKRVAGYGGCNRMTGAYEVSGDTMKFLHMAGTMMACTEGMEYERGFHDALVRAVRWKIDGERLTLIDESGVPLATFESRYMR